MEEGDSEKLSPAQGPAEDSPAPAGRTRCLKRAKQEREQVPARTCVPQSTRSDQLRYSSAPWDAAELLSQKGAMALAKRLEAYWHERGYYAARFWAEPVDERFEKLGSYEVYRVASNLVNGMPPRYAVQPRKS